MRLGERTALSVLHWLFEGRWERTISPLSSVTATDYITERLKRCADTADKRRNLIRRSSTVPEVKEFCAEKAGSDADTPVLASLTAEHDGGDDVFLPVLNSAGWALQIHDRATAPREETPTSRQFRYSVEGTSLKTNPSFRAATARRSSRVTTSSDDGRRSAARNAAAS